LKEFVAKHLLTDTFTVKGKNQTVLIGRIKRANITILRFECKEDVSILILPHFECKKLFAICKDLCYNIIINGKNILGEVRKNRITLTHVGYGGMLSPLYSLYKRKGFLVGIAVFLAFAIFLNGRLLGYSLDGVPIEVKSGVMRSLQTGGANKGVSFSVLDYSALQNKIVEDNLSVSFASVYKRGSFLVVEVVTAENPQSPTEFCDVVASCDGVIEKIVVLRGTALVTVGDEVKKGQPLVGAYYVAGEQSIPTKPVAEIYLTSKFYFTLKVDGCDEYFVNAVSALAREKCPISHIIAQETNIKPSEGGFEITVTLTYKRKQEN